MPADTTEGVAKHSTRLQPSINLHAPVTAFMFSCSGTQCTTPEGWRLGWALCSDQSLKVYWPPTQDPNPGGRNQNHKWWSLHYHCTQCPISIALWQICWTIFTYGIYGYPVCIVERSDSRSVGNHQPIDFGWRKTRRWNTLELQWITEIWIVIFCSFRLKWTQNWKLQWTLINIFLNVKNVKIWEINARLILEYFLQYTTEDENSIYFLNRQFTRNTYI